MTTDQPSPQHGAPAEPPPFHPLPHLPARPANAHKGTAGTVAVVGGCAAERSRMFGAPALAARAALRAGAGIVRLVTPAPILDHAVALTPSATAVGLPTNPDGSLIPHLVAETLDRVFADADALAVGPGLGAVEGVPHLVLRAVTQTDVPVVLDADGLNALAGLTDFARDIKAPCILTPHPGEFRRLAEPLRITASPTDDAARPAAAEQLAQRLGCIVVLKGHRTVVTDGLRTWVCDRGHPCLATAGTGDVLTGLIAGLIAQHVAPGPRHIAGLEMPRPPSKPLDLFDAARLAVQAHALAGEHWAESHAAAAGLLAEELADLLPHTLETLRAPSA